MSAKDGQETPSDLEDWMPLRNVVIKGKGKKTAQEWPPSQCGSPAKIHRRLCKTYAPASSSPAFEKSFSRCATAEQFKSLLNAQLEPLVDTLSNHFQITFDDGELQKTCDELTAQA